MRRPTLAAALLLATALPASAGTDLPTPVCAQSEVLQLVRSGCSMPGSPACSKPTASGRWRADGTIWFIAPSASTPSPTTRRVPARCRSMWSAFTSMRWS